MATTALRVLFLSAWVPFAMAQARQGGTEPDRDGDGLSDFHEIHKYRTDPGKADSDGDGVPDGDWRERREYQYTVRTVVQVMRPVTIEYLCDDYQDARVLDETDAYVELEVIHYPFNTVAETIAGAKDWRRPNRHLQAWLRPGATSDWNKAMQTKLLRELKAAGIDAKQLDDKELVERASKWLCDRAKGNDSFTTFITAFDDRGRPFVPDELKQLAGHDQKALQRQWPRDISARGMFEQQVRGSCSSSAIYLSGSLRALGIPTRTILTIPLVDANDERELRMVEQGITHHRLRERILPALRRLRGSWASHTFNEVWVGGRWRRLNYHRLGQDIADPQLFGMITHVATFFDWADARMPETIGKRQTRGTTDDTFGFRNPYSTIALRDEFGAHCPLDNPAPEAVTAKVTAVHWGDGERAPDFVREWFAKRGVFGLIARVEGPDSFDQFQQLLERADLRVYLVADDKPRLGVGFAAGNWWWKGDHAWIVVPFGRGDREQHVADASYAFVCRNEHEQPKWQLADDLVVPPRE